MNKDKMSNCKYNIGEYIPIIVKSLPRFSIPFKQREFTVDMKKITDILLLYFSKTGKEIFAYKFSKSNCYVILCEKQNIDNQGIVGYKIKSKIFL